VTTPLRSLKVRISEATCAACGGQVVTDAESAGLAPARCTSCGKGYQDLHIPPGTVDVQVTLRAGRQRFTLAGPPAADPPDSVPSDPDLERLAGVLVAGLRSRLPLRPHALALVLRRAIVLLERGRLRVGESAIRGPRAIREPLVHRVLAP
jgi:hypothetical protein